MFRSFKVKKAWKSQHGESDNIEPLGVEKTGKSCSKNYMKEKLKRDSSKMFGILRI